MHQFATVLRARIIQARLELDAARKHDDAVQVELHERRLRYLTGAAAEYGIVVGAPALRLAGRTAAQG